MNGVEFPINGVGVAHGIENSFRVDWLDWDSAAIVMLDGDTVMEFCSSSPNGFINDYDVLDQAREIVAQWDAEEF